MVVEVSNRKKTDSYCCCHSLNNSCQQSCDGLDAKQCFGAATSIAHTDAKKMDAFYFVSELLQFKVSYCDV